MLSKRNTRPLFLSKIRKNLDLGSLQFRIRHSLIPRFWDQRIRNKCWNRLLNFARSRWDQTETLRAYFRYLHDVDARIDSIDSIAIHSPHGCSGFSKIY
jgi:hypothetical protein